MAGSRTPQDRSQLAQHRIRKVLKANTVCGSRTLEQKIADAGPSPMRIDPHVLTPARKALEEAGDVVPMNLDGMRWYHLSGTHGPDIDTKLAVLTPLHTDLQNGAFLKRMGQTLEIATYRALIEQPLLKTLGAYPDMDLHDDSTMYTKEEPPAIISHRSCTGRLDFIVVTQAGSFAGIEIKNSREWLYPHRTEVLALIDKCVALDLVPVLIARRIPFVTFKLLTACGAIVHQTYNQLFPFSDAALAARAQNKHLLGYHDVRLGNVPDARLKKFVAHLPALIEKQCANFDAFKDLLGAFASGSMAYAEFAARVRRRRAGTNEENDWPDEDLTFGLD